MPALDIPLLVRPRPRRLRCLVVMGGFVVAIAGGSAFAVPLPPQAPAAATPAAAPPQSPSASPPVEPLPAAPETAAAPATGTAPPPAETAPSATTAPANAVALDIAAQAPVAAEPDPPIFEKWWFWTAIAAFAVTAVVIVATSSGPTPPKTDLGNMTAF